MDLKRNRAGGRLLQSLERKNQLRNSKAPKKNRRSKKSKMKPNSPRPFSKPWVFWISPRFKSSVLNSHSSPLPIWSRQTLNPVSNSCHLTWKKSCRSPSNRTTSSRMLAPSSRPTSSNRMLCPRSVVQVDRGRLGLLKNYNMSNKTQEKDARKIKNALFRLMRPRNRKRSNSLRSKIRMKMSTQTKICNEIPIISKSCI